MEPRSRRVAIVVAAGLLFFAAAYALSRSIKQSTHEEPAGSPSGAVIESESIQLPAGGPALPGLPTPTRTATPAGPSTTGTATTGTATTGTATTGTATTGT